MRHVDEAKAVAIANTIKYMSTFNQLVRDNVENINVGNRYLDISQMFDSIREDSKSLIKQLDDGKIGVHREDVEPVDAKSAAGRRVRGSRRSSRSTRTSAKTRRISSIARMRSWTATSTSASR